MKNKPKLIIVVGPHGVGKTYLTDYIRNNLECCNLYRLSGQPDKTKEGLSKSISMYEALFSYIENMANMNMTLLFDSFFMTEEAVSNMKDKVYSFHEAYKKFIDKLNSLPYDIYYLNLYLENTDLFQERLTSRLHHAYYAMNKDNSIKLQTIYQNISDELKKQDHIKVFDIPMDSFEDAYREIKRVLGIED